jgi:predicted AlkP superfamily phosphohydrolase/phosphomutase
LSGTKNRSKSGGELDKGPKVGKITRRDFLAGSLKTASALCLWPLASSCTGSKSLASSGKKIVILGIDGMDPSFLEQFIKEGVMPNFQRLAREGSFKRMRSSIPPQSPVAWSDFAVGASPGVHGIFDFIHRDPKTMSPYLSTAQVLETSNTFSIGDWRIPLSGGAVKKLREGKPFWEYLEEAGIAATVFRLPGDFPATSKRARCASGMGTPDLLGSYGTFSFYTSGPVNTGREITGGEVFPVEIKHEKIVSELRGPVNPLKKDKPNIRVPFIVWRDPENEVVKIKLQDHELMLTTGEWTDWIQLSFDVVPHVKSVKGICRLHLKQIHPHFEMYVSPINIDPSDQALPVTGPSSYGRELVQKVGWFNTKGLPADTKALSYGILSEDEYLQQSKQILDESKALMQYELERLQSLSSGVLFFYYSNIDQDSHMFWRVLDTKHPLYTTALGREYADVLRNLYVEMDRVLGDVYRTFDLKDDHFRLIVMSDHGFAPFYRCVNLNTWLLSKGYVSMINPNSQDRGGYFTNVDWSRTKAYGLGINALYINREGRERDGMVSGRELPQLLARLKAELLNLKDPTNGEKAISEVWIGKEIYHRDDDKTPDIVIGWNRGYRASWETILGGFPRDVFVDNDDKWSGDHCIDPAHVPAILLSNRRIALENPSLPDLTATILKEYGIPIPKHMTGKLLYEI